MRFGQNMVCEWTGLNPSLKSKTYHIEHPNVSIKWFEDGELNVSANCIDRHLESRGEQTAIIWEGDNPSESKHVTYSELHQQVSKLANVYKNLGLSKGDRVVLYMPMIPEGSICNAGVCKDWSNSLNCFRRIFT